MPNTNNLLITKEQFNNSILVFIDKYRRLPFLSEDEIEVEVINDESEVETRTYKSSKYIKEYYKNQDKMTEELFSNSIITHKLVGDILGLSETVIKNSINKDTKTPEDGVRRQLEMFFNKDYYPELGLYAKKCEDCAGCTCKHEYWVSVISCPNFKKKTEKEVKVKVKKETKAKVAKK